MILGLDISTTMIGVAVVDEESSRVVHSTGWDLSKIDKVYLKYETVGALLYELRREYNIQQVFIETALKRFIPGKSRADTLIKLAKFNGVVSWLCFETWNKTQYLSMLIRPVLFMG